MMRRNLIDTELFEKLQRYFCRANDVYLACVDRDHNVLTSHYGSDEEQAFLEANANVALTDEQVAQEYWNCIDNLSVTEAENE